MRSAFPGEFPVEALQTTLSWQIPSSSGVLFRGSSIQLQVTLWTATKGVQIEHVYWIKMYNSNNYQKVHKWFNRVPKRLLKWSRSCFGSERNSRFFIEVSSHLSYFAPALWALKYLSISHDLTQVASVLPCLGTSRVARQRNVPKEKKQIVIC